MIKVNDVEVKTGKFPDGTPEMLHVNNIVIYNLADHYSIPVINFTWNYEDDSELVKLIYLVNHYREQLGRFVRYNLFMPYIPNARMDRTKSSNEVFTLKWFAKIINSLEFDNVYVLDPHSDVSVALINNLVKNNVDKYIIDAKEYIYESFRNNESHEIVIYFPDAGAYKRYKDMYSVNNYKKIYGEKVRDWKTGEILGLKVVDENGVEITDHNYLKDKVVLMIDDIISYGGTLYYSTNKIKEFNPYKIYAYATHVEPKSLWDEEKGKFKKSLISGDVERLFTTNSIYNLGDSVNVKVL